MKKQDEVIKIKESAEKELLKLVGVTGIDVGYAKTEDEESNEMVIRIYVANREDVPRKLADMREIQGVRVVLIERRFELH